MAERINGQQFADRVLGGEGLKVVEFYSDTCIPCKRMAPILAEVEEKYQNVFIAKINVAYESELVQKYHVLTSPTVLFFKNGEEITRLKGIIQKKQLEEIIQDYL